MRVLASAIGIAAICVPWCAVAREKAIPEASSQILSVLMLDAGLAGHDRQPSKPGAAAPRLAGVVPMPVGLKPLQPSLDVLHLVRSASPAHARLAMPGAASDAPAPETASADYWREFTGIREMPNPPPTPGSYTDQMIVLSIRDLGRRPSVAVTGGMAGTALRVLGADGTLLR